MAEVQEVTKKGLPTSEYLERYDGSRWRRFDLHEGGFLVLTTRGQELLSHNPELRKKLLGYRNEARRGENSEHRKWFKAGGNSDVYTLGDYPMVIKEASTAHSAWSALDRMDYLFGICVRSLPPHIRVPDHYGVLTSRNLRKQYLLIQKVNDGLTVADLVEGDAFAPRPYLKDLVLREFDGLEDKVKKAIDKTPGRQYMPTNLLPDWDSGNTIVDFDTPTTTMPFTFWIIDQ